jgi:cytochrome o ubiquinol oxidase subunit 2
VQRFASVDASLYRAILNRANKMCMDDMMAIDAKGGMGKPGTFNLASAS